MFINFSFQGTLQKLYLSQPVELHLLEILSILTLPLFWSFSSISGLLFHQYYLKTNSTVLNYISNFTLAESSNENSFSFKNNFLKYNIMCIYKICLVRTPIVHSYHIFLERFKKKKEGKCRKRIVCLTFFP